MIIIEPYAKIYDVGDIEDGIRLLKKIEWIGRISHRSEDAQTHISWEKFITSVVLRHGDWSIVEHATVTVDAVVDRGITHEWVRHRIGAYTQECVTGDTRLLRNLTIKEAYDKQMIGQKIRSSNGSEIVRNKIMYIFNKGPQQVYEIITTKGYKIKATKLHEFQVPSKQFVCLKDLAIGDKVMVNGRPSLLPVNDIKLTKMYDTLTSKQIQQKLHVNRSSVVRRLHQLGIFEAHKNDGHLEKYNRNHTAQSYQKISETIRQGFRDGRVVWNKGLREEDDERVKIQANALREHHHNNGYGAANSAYKSGVDRSLHKKVRQVKAHIHRCEICGTKGKLEVHHIDENASHNDWENLIKLCKNCHGRAHASCRIGIMPIADTIISITDAGIEETYDLEMATHHNYLANGFIVHNSTRFVNYEKKIPPKFVMPEWLSPRQKEIWEAGVFDAEKWYKELLAAGCAPQIARSVFPNALSSRIVVTYNLRNWRHFFLMRTTREAHPQMRQVTIPLLEEFKQRIPLLYDDIEPNEMQAVNLAKAR